MRTRILTQNYPNAIDFSLARSPRFRSPWFSPGWHCRVLFLTFFRASLLDAQSATIISGRVWEDSALVVSAASIEFAYGRTVSDSAGRFRLSGVPSGRHVLIVRKPGFVPESVVVDAAGPDSVVVVVRLMPVAAVLPSVEVEGRRVSAKMVGFEERKRLGVGRFLTEDEIARGPGTRLSDKLRVLPGVRVLYSRGGSMNQVRIATTRGPDGFRNIPCYVRVIVDGAHVPPDFSINHIDPNEVAALEWYAGPSQIPAQYNISGNSCGLLIIWTK
jgi:hypothetical protein